MLLFSKRIRPYLYIFGIAFVAALAGLLLGYDAGVIADSKEQVTHLFNLSDSQWSIIASSSIFGALVGLTLGGKLSTFIGRKTMLILVAIGFMLGIIFTATASSMLPFLIGRFIIGISVGIGSYTAPLFISEISPPKIRGALILLNGLAITSGQALSFLMGYILHDYNAESWRYIIWIGMVPSLCLFTGMLFIPQSPRWIAMKFNIEQAYEVLKKVRGGDSQAVRDELQEIQVNIQSNRITPTIRSLFSKRLLPVTFVGIGLGLFQQLVGISTLMYYGPVIFAAAGFTPTKNAIFATLGIGLVNLVVTLFTIFLVDYAGRRILLLTGTVIAGISLIFVGAMNIGWIHGKWLTFFFMATYISGYCISLGSLFWVMIAEIYPLNTRGLAMSMASAAETGASLLVTLTFLQLLNTCGISGTFWIYSLMCFAAAIFIYLFVPETKGVSLESIEANLNAGKKARDLGVQRNLKVDKIIREDLKNLSNVSP